VSIVDEEGRDLPQGTTGEIAVQGRDLPLGYFRDDALTAARYQTAVDAPGERRYLTGDLGRLRTDGQLEHLGRKDRRVKVRGFRIELDEIEHTLLQHPGVARVAVEAMPDRRGDVMLVAYLEPTGPTAASAADFRAFLGPRLADYKIPSRFIALAQFPMSDSGKIVRSRLPAVEASQALTGTPRARAETTLQALVTGVWIEVLGDDGIGIDDSFLMVGGDSLRAAQIASRLSTALGADVPLTLLLEAETIRRLAERLEGLGSA
jgi:nonribosomal peptide synthetase DhbF